jgi:hypothetical protein
MKMKRNPNCSCKVCNTKIYRRPVQIQEGNVYCSLTCNGVAQRQNKVCKICKKTYVGAKVTCSRACANKARTGIIYTKENAFNKAYKGTLLKEKISQKRGGVCEKCSHTNYAILQVHHKKERHKGGTDDMANLELLCPNCHTTHHYGKSLYKDKKML